METTKTTPRTTTHACRPGLASVGLYAAAGLSATIAVAVLRDQLLERTVAGHAASVYAGTGAEADSGLLYGLLYATAAVLTLAWWGAARAARSSRKALRWLGIAAAASLTVALAATLLMVSEYGERLFQPQWGLFTAAALLPAGWAVAVAIRERRRPERR